MRKNETEEVAYEFMEYDPRSELPDYEGARWDSTGVEELYLVLNKSWEARRAG